MSIIIGIDVGGSTTKIVGFDGNKLIEPMRVKASDQVASLYGAFGKFTNERQIELNNVEKIMVTGVGSTFINDNIFGISTCHVSEFTSTGKGGLYISHLNEAIVVSMGTGTALVHATGENNIYLGGTGVGGGTLTGLSKKILQMQNVVEISQIAENGDPANIDLQIGDITEKDIIPTLSQTATAANFGRISDMATNSDYALGIINLVLETIGMMAIFAARGQHLKDIVMTGNISSLKQSKDKFAEMSAMFGMNFIIPDNSLYATAIGSALSHFDSLKKGGNTK